MVDPIMENHPSSPDPLRTLDQLATDRTLPLSTRIAAEAAARELRGWRAAADVARYAERGSLAVALDQLCTLADGEAWDA
jgi:hypothetical protein